MRRLWLGALLLVTVMPIFVTATDAQIAPGGKSAPPFMPLASAIASGHVGKYVHSEMELAAGLWLKADGSFEYWLTVGSLDETAKGRWTAKGRDITLINVPVPVLPTITVGPATRSNNAFQLVVKTPSGRGVEGVDFIIGFDTGEPLEGYTQSYGWTLPTDEKREPRWVSFSMQSYNLQSPRFPIDTRTANALNFVLTPNDFGVVNFAGSQVIADSDGITITRSGQPMKFEKQASD